MLTFNNRIDKYPEPVNDLTEGQTVLVTKGLVRRTVRPNWQLAKVLNTLPVLTSEGLHVIRCEVLGSDEVVELQCRRQGSEVVTLGIQSGKMSMEQWKTNETKRITDELAVLKRELDIVLNS